MTGRNIAHERMCIPLVRARRAREGKISAAGVMTLYWQRRRIAEWVKTQTIYKYRYHHEFDMWSRDHEAEARAKSIESAREPE